MLDPRGPVGLSERLILLDSLAIMLAIIVPVIFATLRHSPGGSAPGTRRRPTGRTGPSPGTLELIVWAIPALVITFLGGIAWFGSHALDPYRPLRSTAKPVEVEVVSLDWKWLFIYPDEGVATVNQLVIPVGSPVHFRLTSSGVMNSFFVPQLGSQIYTMAGMTSQLSLQADKPGDQPRPVRAIQRPGLRRHALHRARAAGGRLRPMARQGEERGAGARQRRLCRAG